MKNLTEEELTKVSGGIQIPKTIRVICRRCGLEFDVAYDSVVVCPKCGNELPTWQGGGTLFKVIEWTEK